MKALDATQAAARAADRIPFAVAPGDVPDVGQSPLHRRASEVDRHVGARIRIRRVRLGLSQHQLAVLIGVTLQQQHKYERGTNRISAGRLLAIARALDVSVDAFFVGLDGPRSKQHDLTLELVRAVAEIGDKRHRAAICLLARVLAADEAGFPAERVRLNRM